MKKALTVLAIVILVPVLLCGGLYLFMAWKYSSTYVTGVMINGIYAAGMTPSEVNEQLVAKTPDPTFYIEDKTGEQTDIPIAEMNYEYSYMDGLNSIIEKQNPLLWGVNMVNQYIQEEEVKPVGTCDLDQLDDYLREMDLIKNQADPKKVKVEIKRTKQGYELIDETQNLLDVDLAVDTIKNAVSNGEDSVNLEESDCYITMNYTKGMQNTLKLWDKIDELQSMDIVCTFYNGDEVVDSAEIARWIAKDENGDFALDEDGNLVIDEDAVGATVEAWANRRDSVGGPWTFKPTRGGTVTIEEGTYGYKLNQKEQKKYLLDLINERKSDKSEAIYSQKGWGKGVSDIGDTYIEVDMTDQMLYYYVKGRVKLKTPVVTGCTGRGNSTPERVCYIYFKQRNRVLIGPDYRTPVSYWMAVYNHIGIHDANWRGKFGGEIYKTNGSHGCVNTPTSEVSKLYDMAEVGTPVVMFY